MTNARGGVTAYTYDAQGRLETIEDPRDIVWLTNEYAPPPCGDRRARPTTEYAYNETGKLTQITKLADTVDAVSTDVTYEPDFQQLAGDHRPNGARTELRVDSRGALVTITDARGEEWT